MAQPSPLVVPVPAQGVPAHVQCASRAIAIFLAYARLLSRIAQPTLVVRLFKSVILAMTVYLVLDALLAILKIMVVFIIIEHIILRLTREPNVQVRAVAAANPAPLLRSLHGIANIMPAAGDVD